MDVSGISFRMVFCCKCFGKSEKRLIVKLKTS